MSLEYEPASEPQVVPIGGNAKIPGFQARLEREIRALAPCDFEVCCRANMVDCWKDRGPPCGTGLTCQRQTGAQSGQWRGKEAKRQGAVERIWHTQDSQRQILALAFR